MQLSLNKLASEKKSKVKLVAKILGRDTDFWVVESEEGEKEEIDINR